MRNYSIPDDQDLNVKQMDYQLPLHALHLSKDIYVNYPWFQREQVWSSQYQYELIKTIVQGGFVPSILTTPVPGDPSKKWIVDGQQRMRTITGFMSALECDLQHRPLPREAFYFRLTDRQQQRFMSALIRFTDLLDVDEDQLSTIFLRLQNQMTLKTAERLWATTGKMRNLAAQIMQHPYFTTIYRGNTLRMQPYQMATYPVVLEMYRPFADMSGTRLLDLAKRRQGDVLESSAEVTISENLTAVCHLFQGVQSEAMTEIIIQYQAAWLLSFIGVDVEASKPGALYEWYLGIEKMNRDYRQKGFMNLFAQFTQAKIQKLHWLRWLDEIVYNDYGLKFRKSHQSLAQLQRVTGWLRANGICNQCNNAHVQLAQVGEHVFRPADAHDIHRVNCKDKAKEISPQIALSVDSERAKTQR